MVWAQRYAVEQNKLELVSWLYDVELKKDIAVLISIEFLVQLAFCLMHVVKVTSGFRRKRSECLYAAAHYFPGVLVYVVAFFLLVWLDFSLPGRSFGEISGWTGVGSVVVLLGGGELVLWLIPERDLRLELLYWGNMLLLFLCILGAMSGANMIVGGDGINWGATAFAFATIAMLMLVGYVVYRIKNRLKVNRP